MIEALGAVASLTRRLAARLAPGLALSLVMGLAFIAIGAMAARGGGVVVKAPDGIESGEFCETDATFDTSTCTWQQITLPHRWSPGSGDQGWGVYRFRVRSPGIGEWGLVTDGLSMRGTARIGHRVREPVTLFEGRGEHLRFWPQLFLFSLSDTAGDTLRIDLLVQGHVLSKNGLTELTVTAEDAARRLYLRALAKNIGFPLAVAAALGMAGVIAGLSGLRIGGRARLLLPVSLLALLAALRSVVNFVPDPLMSVRAWSVLNFSLYVYVGLAMIAIPALHLKLLDRRRLAAMLGVACLVIPVFVLLPARAVVPAWEGALILLAAIGLWLVMRLLAVALQFRRPEDLKMAAIFLLILAFPIHDLLVHLGPNSMSSDYRTLWAVPALLPVMVVMLIRQLLSNHSLQVELQREGERRETLMRDLHDVVGSRLVALSFHACRSELDVAVVNELDALIQEVQLIQRSVRPGPVLLDHLLADLRYRYSGIGGGNLPLVWESAEDLPAYELSSEQAVAITRILSESIANALKHARPTEIRISLGLGDEPGSLQLSIADNGAGTFRADAGSGLGNIAWRAEQAGLRASLKQSPGHKMVTLTFPPPPKRGTWRQRLRRIASPAVLKL